MRRQMRRWLPRCTNVLILWTMSTLASSTPCQAQSAAPRAERFDALVQAAMKDETVGVAVAVTFRGELVYAKAFGLANVETKEPVTLDTVWTPSQLSEIYSAAVAASLSRDAVLALDVPIATYWPALRPPLGRATIRQLFQHRAGIKDDHIDHALLDAEALKRYALSCDVDCVIAEPGYVESFSSRSGNIAAAVIEQTTGRSFSDLLDERVFKPMGFTRSSLSILHAATQSIAQGHRMGSSGVEVVRPIALDWVGWPTTSVFTSMSEGIAFIGALVNEGRWQGRQVFSSGTVAETLSLLFRASGSGAFRSRTGWAGIRGITTVIPEERYGFLMFVNGPAKKDVIETVTSAAQAIWPESAVASPGAPAAGAAAVTTKISEKEVIELTGVYRNEWVVRLEWRNGFLMFLDEGTSYRNPSDWIEVNRVSDTQLLLARPSTGYGPNLTVVRSASGTVTHIVHGGRALRKEPY
jgi:CubicO group peptidase (beta-lactamase class C family)